MAQVLGILLLLGILSFGVSEWEICKAAKGKGAGAYSGT